VLPGVAGLSVLASFWWWRGRPFVATVTVGTAGTLVLLALVWPGAVKRLTRLVDRMAHAIAAGVSLVLLGVTWLLVVMPVSLLNRLLGLDVLARGAAGRWRPVAPTERARRLYGREAQHVGDRARRALRLAVVVLAVGASTAAVVDRATTVPPPPVTPFGSRGSGEVAGVVHDDTWVTYRGDPVSRHLFPGEPWGADVLRAQEDVAPCNAVDVRADYASHYRLATEHVNVVDGRRRTYSVGRPEHTVWMFGGSTTYGIGQRDDHTIPSALVRAAQAEGVALAVRNFGCPGKVNWAETTEFELLLRSGAPRPDVALFLDGINEWNAAFTREIVGLLDPSVPFSGYASNEHQASLLADADERGYVETHDQERQATLAAAQYRMGVERGRALGEEFDVPVVHVWQPALFTMPEDAPGNATVFHSGGLDPASSTASGRFYAAAAVRSGVDPIDLMDIFDDATQPYFFDCCHTNEAGARLEAEALLPYVLDALEP
jgi:hypothetical protein